MKIKFNFSYKKDCLFEINIDYVLRDSFYQLEYNFKNNLELYRNGTLKEHEVISNELIDSIDNLERHFANLMIQLRCHYKIHSYFFQQDIESGKCDCRQELKFIYDLLIPLVNNLVDRYKENSAEIEVDW